MSPNSQGFIASLLKKSASTGDACYFTFLQQRYSFSDLEKLSRAFAQKMLGLGLKKGDRVAVMLRNSPELITCIFGLARESLIWVPINPELRSNSLRHVIEHSEPSVLIVTQDALRTIESSGADVSGMKTIIVDTPAWDIPERARVLSAPCVETRLPDENDVFSIMYTSGTTGAPKGVLVTHKMIQFAAKAAVILADANDKDILFMWEPMFHVAGAQVLLMPLLLDVELAVVPKFSASQFWSQVRDSRATHIHYLGGILHILMKQPPKREDTAHYARIAWGAGCTPEIWEAFQSRFNLRIHESYGMTETSSIASVNKTGTVACVGTPVPWFDIEIIGEDGQQQPPGKRGEIVVIPKQPGSIFAGYYKNERATHETLRNDRVYTKDLGVIDETGLLYFHGRITDSMRCRGENVSAWEIESVVSGHPSVEACAVIGVDATIGEQEIKLFVQFKPGVVESPADLSQWLAQHLASFQNPRYIEVVSEFERTPSQRIMKHTLSRNTEQCWDRHQPAAVSAHSDHQ